MKQQMPLFYLAAIARYRADSLTSITQLTNYISTSELTNKLTTDSYDKKWDELKAEHDHRLKEIAEKAQPLSDGSFGTGHCLSILTMTLPKTKY